MFLQLLLIEEPVLLLSASALCCRGLYTSPAQSSDISLTYFLLSLPSQEYLYFSPPLNTHDKEK